MLRRLSIALLVLLALIVVPAASGAEPAPKGAEGTFELQGTNGYRLFAIIASTGKTGVLALFATKHGAQVNYTAHGEVTAEHVHFDLGQLGEIDLAVKPTGRMEEIGSECDNSNKPTKVEGEEYVGTIDFHGEEGFTEVEASRAPLRLKPIFDLVCGGLFGRGTVSGRGLPGVQLMVKGKNGLRLQLNQNHPGAPVVYEASTTEKEGNVQVNRAVAGSLGSGALAFEPSLEGASFSGGAPFSGEATYVGKRPWHETRPGAGAWRGSLKIDFPGDAGVRLAGPAFSATIIHAKRTETHPLKG